MRKVVKFGGSSLASAEQFKKVGDIIRADKGRKYVVPSAPGKRFDGDIKVTDMLYACYAKAEKKEDFNPRRKDIPCVAEMPKEELKALIAENPLYGNVICRCETVTEGEIVNAIRRPLGAKSLDGVKRRTRAGMGRCQSGFCAPKVMEILKRELQKSPLEITKAGGKSTLLTGKIKEEFV